MGDLKRFEEKLGAPLIETSNPRRQGPPLTPASPLMVHDSGSPTAVAVVLWVRAGPVEAAVAEQQQAAPVGLGGRGEIRVLVYG